MGAGYIDYDRSINLFTTKQCDALDMAVCLSNFGDLCLEAERRTLGFCGTLNVVNRKLWIVDIAAARKERCPSQRLSARLTEMFVARAARRVIGLDVKIRRTLLQSL